MSANNIAWKKGRGQWTATVGHVQLTITPPYADSPLSMYHYEFIGPSIRGKGGASSLAGCQRAAEREMYEADKREGLKTATNVTEVRI